LWEPGRAILNGVSYQTLKSEKGVPIKAWIHGVPLEDAARKQLLNVAQLPFVFKWVAAMPDVHWGIGATVGSVIPTEGAIIPAAVGVDIGCGMMAVQTDLNARDLPDDLHALRTAIEEAVPHGRTHGGGKGDVGAWGIIPDHNLNAWSENLKVRYDAILEKHPKLDRGNHANHLGTLGTGNHFIEVCLDESEMVWFMLHSGSRGVGNRMGTYFIELAKKDMGRLLGNLPDKDLAYPEEGSEHFYDYVEAVEWAQDFATTNRDLMMEQIIEAVGNFWRSSPLHRDGACHPLPSQLCGQGAPLWPEHFRHPERRRARAGRRSRHHSRQHGGTVLHRTRQR
jgi:tRNA-splicing ligase RtcB (3'-phosphate/5'-hydroxy nucleic acid ligase)